MNQDMHITQRQMERNQQPDRAAPKLPSIRRTGQPLPVVGDQSQDGIMAKDDRDEQSQTEGALEKFKVKPRDPAPSLSSKSKVEGGLTRFFNSLFRGVGELIEVSVKSLFSGILGAALLPFFGPVVAIGVSLGVMAAVIEIQENLKPLGLHLQDDTIRKLAEPLQGKRPDERELRKMIEEVLSEDRQANKDLAKAFIKLLPIINKAAAATNIIEFSGPIKGLTIGDHNTVTQTFEGFLHEKL